MPGPGDEKDPPSKSPFDDQPTSAERSTLPLRPAGASGRADTPLHALEQRYEILGEAGRGGMGIVYKARDRETGELVALKVLKPEIANDAAIIERFKDELKLARKVTHKNVCRIHEFNRAADGSAYISMEFVEGDSLRRILARFGQFATRTGVQVAQQICAGLGEAHAQGFVHRDLKPENIMLDQGGNVKIMDFGIARSLEATTTQSSGILGTPAYMSPEQAAGKKADHRADIYSLGLILYEMFTGSRAFTGQTPVEVALKQVHETPPAPRTVEPALSGYIEKAILKCLEKNPDKRFQSVGQLEAALTQQAEEKPIAAKDAEVAMPARLAFWQRSDWYLLGSAVLGLILFFPLFYRFHPASALVITVTAEQARQIGTDALKKLGWVGEAEKPDLWFAPESLEWGPPTLGYSALPGKLRSGGISTGWWGGGLKFGEGRYARGRYEVDPEGRLFGVTRRLRGILPTIEPEPPPDAATRELARDALRVLYGQDVAVGEPTRPWDPHLHLLIWNSTRGTGGYPETLAAEVEGSNITELGRHVDFPDMTGESDTGFVFRSLQAALTLPLFPLILFFLRRLYRQPRSAPNLGLAALVALGSTLVLSSSVDLLTKPGEWVFQRSIVLALVFCISVLLCYAVLNTVLYYTRSRYPAQVAGYLLLIREHFLARGAGLALLRGIFAGLAFSGCWMAIVSLAGPHGQALPGAMGWLSCFYGGWVLPGIFKPSHLAPLVVGEALLVGWLLVAFPLSLLGRVSRRRRVLLLALAALWLAFGFSLGGARVFPTVAYYVFVVLQAVFFGALFLRYDLLTTLSAAFTIEVFLLAFPFLEVFQQIDPLPYFIPICLWALLLLASAGLYFRPQLVAGYRRLAAVFE